MLKWWQYFKCVTCHSWRHWTVLRVRPISYMDWVCGGKLEQADYYCCRCEREWTVERRGQRPPP